MDYEAIVTRIRTLIDPLLVARHVELVELTCRREGPGTVLRFLVDTAAGITVGECGALNQTIGAVLDEHDVIPERYTLEVASPGLDRLLKTARDFERVIGRRVVLAVAEPVNGARQVVGTVASVGDEALTLRLDHGEKLRVALASIVRAQQEISFHR